jgi:tetratricopeptide (TPR) repeat protein
MPEDADKALPLLSKAVELEPDFAAAHAIIAWCHEARYLRGGMQEETRLAALRHARLAIAGGSDDAAALATAGFVIAVCGRDFETALNAFDRSFALSSSSALALGFSSLVRAWKGDEAIAVEQANRALRLSPSIHRARVVSGTQPRRIAGPGGSLPFVSGLRVACRRRCQHLRTPRWNRCRRNAPSRFDESRRCDNIAERVHRQPVG